MSGNIFFSAQLDTLASQMHITPHVTQVFQKVIDPLGFHKFIRPEDANIGISSPTHKSRDSINELSDIISFRVPKFMKDVYYWQLFHDIYE